MRRRVHWLEIATVLGAITPFLPFVWFFRDLSLVDCLIERIPPDSMILLVPPAFLPIFILAWLWRRRSVSDPTTPTWPMVTRLLAVTTMTSCAVGTFGMVGMESDLTDLGWTAAFFLPIVANLGLWWRNHRRELSLDATSEMLLLGTYVATTLPWTFAFLYEGALIAAWLIATVGVVYCVAIVVRLRSGHPIQAASP